ncbi:HAMP domain-containing sensor histidine kinase [Clostridium sediminicola]
MGSAVLVVSFILWIKHRNKKMLSQLADNLQDLINGHLENNKFVEIEDNMISKLQSLVVKLKKIHIAKENRIIEERNNISELVSDISHQLKTPLANLNIYNSFVMESQKNATNSNFEYRSQLVSKMQSQIEKLNWLMDGLMKVSKLESNLIEIKKEYASINKTILTAIRQAYISAEVKNIEIEYKSTKEISILHDIRWTTEAIFNIIDNAIKYSSVDSKIIIRIIPYEIFLRIDIEDHGIGIKEAEINKIFSRFYRSVNVSSIEGVGIGLYLSRQIIEEQKGYIKVKSELGKGSTFSIFLQMG